MSFIKFLSSVFCKKTSVASTSPEQKSPTVSKNYIFGSVFPNKEMQDRALLIMREEE